MHRRNLYDRIPHTLSLKEGWCDLIGVSVQDSGLQV